MSLDMWTKPWNMKEGFLIGGGLIIAGLALQLSVGPVVWDAFAWPANGIVLSGFFVLLTTMICLRKKVYAFQWMSTYQAAIPAMVYAVVMTIIMGLTRQQVNGTWLNNMLSFWPFVLIYVYITVILGVIILRRLMHLSSWKRDVPFLLNHLGLFIALITATLGNADMQRLKLITFVGQIEWRGVNEENRVVETPLAIELKRFIMETYDNGQPKRYASEIVVRTKSGDVKHAIVDVNKPVRISGWKIYQYGYDTQKGAQSQMSILELVRDPWLPAVYTGIYLMLFGALLMFMRKGRKEEKRR